MYNLTENGYYKRRLNEIEQSLNSGENCRVVREAGVLFEHAMRRLLDELILKIDRASDRDSIFKNEQIISGTGRDSTYHDFSLGELIHLFQSGQVLEKCKRYLSISTTRINRRIHWGEISELRNRASHEESIIAGIDDDDAQTLFSWLKLFLGSCGFLDSTRDVVDASNPKALPPLSCPKCRESIRHEWHFCPMCGTGLRPTCISCLKELDPLWKICPYCETAIAGETSEKAVVQNEYLIFCRGAWLDNVTTLRERNILEAKRLELGLSRAEAEQIEQSCIPSHILEYHHCVQAALSDGVLNQQERTFLQNKAESLNINNELAEEIERTIRDVLS